MDNEYLSHHGILGQKWGIRRYQNKDGSLTEQGRKHYMSKAAKDIEWADKYFSKKGSNAAVRSLAIQKIYENNPAITEFKANSEKYKDYDESAKRLKQKSREYSDQINKELIKKYGNFLDLDSKTQEAYLKDGFEMMNKFRQRVEFNKLMTDVQNTSKSYEKEVNEFINKYRNDVMDKKSIDKNSISYNIKTGAVSKQTIGQIMILELLRDSNGVIHY